MTISESNAYSLSKAFHISPCKFIINHAINYIGVDAVIKASNTEFFIPTTWIPYAIYHYSFNRDIVIPLSVINRAIKKTASAIINYSSNIYSDYKFAEIDTTKGYVYRCCTGFILDNDYKPLMLCGYMVKRGINKYEYTEPVCYISPKVFTRDDVISKFIVKKAIPYYSNLRVFSDCDARNVSCANHNIKIIISSDIDNIIHQAEAPLSIDIDNTMYDILTSADIIVP